MTYLVRSHTFLVENDSRGKSITWTSKFPLFYLKYKAFVTSVSALSKETIITQLQLHHEKIHMQWKLAFIAAILPRCYEMRKSKYKRRVLAKK